MAGSLLHSMSSYSNYWMMPLDAEVDFRMQQIGWVEQGQAAGRAEALAQAAQTGLLNGSGQGGAMPYPGGFWSGFNYMLHLFSYIVIPGALIGTVLAFVMEMGPVVAFFSSALFVGFALHAVLLNSGYGRTNSFGPSLIAWSLGAGLTVGALVGFGLYLPLIEKKDSTSSDTKNIAAGGVAGGAFAVVAVVMFMNSRYRGVYGGSGYQSNLATGLPARNNMPAPTGLPSR